MSFIKFPESPLTSRRLSIKSEAPSATAPGAPTPKAAYAVLCTPNKTFQLRQVQTSNSLFITLPSLETHGNEIPTPTTRAIASCSATLELHPSDGDPADFLKHVLPLYDFIDGEADATSNGKSKASILPDMPFSNGQCEQAWKTLMAFELAGISYRPTANTLSQVWRSIKDAAYATGSKLDQQFLTADLAKDVAEEGYPTSLVMAVFRFLTADDQDLKWACLDRTKTVQFVGKTLLEAKREGRDYLTAEFLDAWKDSLPESWRGDAELNTIKGEYDLPTSTTVRIKDSAAATAKAETAAKGSSSRKWHEKLGRTRKK